MKQKFVIRISMEGHKSRSKALKIVVGVPGVESAALKGDDKSQIEVTGDGTDAVALTSLLRKKVGYAELVSVGPVEGQKPKQPEVKEPPVQHSWPSQWEVPYCDCHVVMADRHPDPCSIM